MEIVENKFEKTFDKNDTEIPLNLETIIISSLKIFETKPGYLFFLSLYLNFFMVF